MARVGKKVLVVRKALSAAFLPKILTETLSVSAERNSPISAFLRKGLFQLLGLKNSSLKPPSIRGMASKGLGSKGGGQ